MCTFPMLSNSQIHNFVHGKSHSTTGSSLNSGFYLDFCCSINLWIGLWYASVDVDPADRETRPLNLFSVLSQIMGSVQSKP
jgi:hypothetical protein